MKIIKTIFILTLLFLGVFLVSNDSFAQTATLEAEYLEGRFQGQALPGVIEAFSNVVLFSSLEGTNCSGAKAIYYILRDETSGALVADGQSNFFEYIFNSGPPRQKNKYRGYFYCSSQDFSNSVSNPNEIESFVLPNNFWRTSLFDQTTVGGACNLSNPTWKGSGGRIGQEIEMEVTGNLGCKGRGITFEILKENSFRVLESFQSSFPNVQSQTLKATASWTPTEEGFFRFDAKAEGNKDAQGNDPFKAKSDGIRVTTIEDDDEGVDPGGGGTVIEQTTPIETSEDFGPPYGNAGFMDILDSILTWLIRIAVPLGIIMIVVAGIYMIIAQGNPGTVNTGKQILLYAVLGLAIIFIGRGFITLIQSILNLAQ